MQRDVVISVVTMLFGVAVSPLFQAGFDRFTWRHLASDVIGDWFSTWEPREQGKPAWVSERIRITRSFGRLYFSNFENNSGYSYKGKIIAHRASHFLGTWQANDSRYKGAFLLTLAGRDKILFGQTVGPVNDNSIRAGGFVLGRTLEDIEAGKLLLKTMAAAPSRRRGSKPAHYEVNKDFQRMLGFLTQNRLLL